MLNLFYHVVRFKGYFTNLGNGKYAILNYKYNEMFVKSASCKHQICRGSTTNIHSKTKATLCSSEGRILHIKERKIFISVLTA